MVETLAQCTHEEARVAAREGLRRWLPLKPENALKISRALDSQYKPEDAKAIYAMLWGFSRDDVTNSMAVANQFMAWMNSDRIEIREFADWWVEKLMERKTDYHANSPESSRRMHIHRLEQLIVKNNGLVKAP